MGDPRRKKWSNVGVFERHWIPADMKHVLPRFRRPRTPGVPHESVQTTTIGEKKGKCLTYRYARLPRGKVQRLSRISS